MKLGLRWQIGTGDSIFLWGDPWVPPPTPFILKAHVSDDALLETRRQFPSNATVRDVMITSSSKWNIPLLESLFPQSIITGIKSIPLSKFWFFG